MQKSNVKALEIYNVWGNKKVFELKFRKNITFLTGFNGTGKTTALEFLFFLLSNSMADTPAYKEWGAKVVLENNTGIFAFDMGNDNSQTQNRINSNLNKLKNQDEIELIPIKDFYEKVTQGLNITKNKNIKKNKGSSFSSNIASNESESEASAAKISFSKHTSPYASKDISEIINPIFYREEVFIAPDRPYTNQNDNSRANIYEKSIILGFTLKELLIDFLSFEKDYEHIKEKKSLADIEDFFDIINDATGNNEDLKKEIFSKIYDRVQKSDRENDLVKSFEFKINSFFECTGKVICRDGRGLIGFKDKYGKVIEASKLSRGEKNVLILLMLAFLSRDEKKVFILDEPDLTLHLEWQKKIISTLNELSPKSQFIIATHSPALFMNDVDFEVINMLDVTEHE